MWPQKKVGSVSYFAFECFDVLKNLDQHSWFRVFSPYSSPSCHKLIYRNKWVWQKKVLTQGFKIVRSGVWRTIWSMSLIPNRCRWSQCVHTLPSTFTWLALFSLIAEESVPRHLVWWIHSRPGDETERALAEKGISSSVPPPKYARLG